MEMNTASCSTSAANYRPELVMVLSRLVKLTNSWVMSAGHMTRRVYFFMSYFGSIHTPLAPMPKVFGASKVRSGTTD